MRRNYKGKEQQPQPLPPFAENLVFWAPLTEGDLTDHISGKTPITDNLCSVSWDTSKEMYMLTASGSSSSRYGALKYSGLNMGLADGQDITFVLDFEEFSGSGNGYNLMFGVPATTEQIPTIAYMNHYRYTSQANYNNVIGYGRYACVYSGTTCQFYKNGVLINTATAASWSGIKFTANTASICQLNTNNTRYTMFGKNARIYNRALSASEVAQL